MFNQLYKKIVKFDNLKNIFLATILSLLAAFLGVIHVIIGYINTDPGFTYLATGHYHLDYFLYLQAIAQGLEGRWLPLNYLTSFDNSVYLRSFPHILLGQFGRLFNLSPMFIYWLAVFIFTVIFILLMYFSIRRILGERFSNLTIMALTLAIFSGPFYTTQPIIGGLSFTAYDFWTGPSIFARRFGTIPYHLLSYILVLLVLLYTAKLLNEIQKTSWKNIFIKILIISLIVIFVSTFSPFNAITLLISIYLVVDIYILRDLIKARFNNNDLKLISYLLGIGLLVIPSGLILKNIYSSSGLFQQISGLESQWQEINMSFSFIFLNFGPIIIFFPFGLWDYFKYKNSYKIIFLTYFLISYGLFLSPAAKYLGTHNLRFLSSINYIFFGALAVLGINKLAGLIKFKKKLTIYLIFFLVFIYSTVFNIHTVVQRFYDLNLRTPISYLPNNLIDGLNLLKKEPEKKVVLTGPFEHIGLVIPVFSHKRVYVGRTNETPEFEKKQAIAYSFYQGAMEEKEAKDFLKKNNIGFVVLASLDNFNWRNVDSYSFLKQIFSNQYIIIWRVI